MPKTSASIYIVDMANNMDSDQTGEQSGQSKFIASVPVLIK